MPQIIIANLKSKSIQFQNKRERLLDILLKETDWMHACGGKGRCTTCKAKIISGKEALSDLTVNELRFVNLNKLHENERLACQVIVEDDVTIEVPKETQLPHLNYT